MIKFTKILKVLLVAVFICICSNAKAEDKPVDTPNNAEVSATFCSSGYGIFSQLVQTGQRVFNRLRDLIYVVAGFGIIAVAVGGFFGNLNWKWLGAIVISLVVIATAGELIVLMTGCETFGSELITTSLYNPAPMTSSEYQEAYTVPVDYGDGSNSSSGNTDSSSGDTNSSGDGSTTDVLP